MLRLAARRLRKIIIMADLGIRYVLITCSVQGVLYRETGDHLQIYFEQRGYGTSYLGPS